MKRFPLPPNGETDFSGITAEQAYENNESGQDDFYPVGVGNAWHSGVHVNHNGSFPVYPLLDGSVAAYRITDEYLTVTRLSAISGDEYLDMDEEERKNYEPHPDAGITRAEGTYRLVRNPPSRADPVSNSFVLLRHGINLPKDIKINFFTLYMNLLPDSRNETVKKYREYQPLTSGNITELQKTDFPFYRNWEIKIAADKDSWYYNLPGVAGKKVFPSSHFRIAPKGQNVWQGLLQGDNFEDVEFDTAPGKYFQVPAPFAEISSVKLQVKPNSSFHAPMPGQSPAEAGKLKAGGQTIMVSGKELKELNANRRADTVQIQLPGSAVESFASTCWIFKGEDGKPEYFEKADGQNDDIYSLKKQSVSGRFESVPFEFIQYRQESPSSVRHKTVSERYYFQHVLKDFKMTDEKRKEPKVWIDTKRYNIKTGDDGQMILELTETMERAGNISRTDSDGTIRSKGYRLASDTTRLVLVNAGIEIINFDKPAFQAKPHDSALLHADSQIMAFFHNGKLLLPVVDLSGKFNEIKPEPALSGLVSYVVKPMGYFSSGDYVKKAASVPAEYSNLAAQKIIPVKYHQPENRTRLWAVAAGSLEVKEIRGRLAGSPDDRAVKPGTLEKCQGLTVFDNPGISSGVKTGNPIGLAEKNSSFRLDDIHDFIKPINSMFCQFNHDGKAAYLEVSSSLAHISARTVPVEKNTFDGNIKTPKAGELKLNVLRCLGYPARDYVYAGRHFYDLALFLKDTDFFDRMKDNGVDENHHAYIYRIPPEIPLYTKSSLTGKKAYFPAGTVFGHTEETVGTDKAYCLKLAKMPIFYPHNILGGKADICPLVAGQKKYRIEANPDRIFLSGKRIGFADGTISYPDAGKEELEKFAVEFNSLMQNSLLKGKEFVSNGEESLDPPSANMLFDFSVFPGFSYTVWLTQSEFGKLKAGGAEKSGGTVTAKENLTITCHDDNPLYSTFEIKERTASNGLNRPLAPKSLSLTGHQKTPPKEYMGFEHAGNTGKAAYYVEKDKETEIMEDAYVLKNYFTKYGSDDDGDIFCDIREVVSRLENLSGMPDRVKESLAAHELRDVFVKRNMQGNRQLVEELRKIICLHPLEWNKNLYDDMCSKLRKKGLPYAFTEEEEKYDQDTVAATELWEGIKDLEGIKGGADAKGNLWFAHPVYFVNHLDKMKALGFNPYMGKPFAEGTPHEVIVKDSPGFAPYGANNSVYSGYYPPTSFFNQDFLEVHKNDPGKNYIEYYHEGVDFACDEGTEIRSLIHGIVMLAGTHQKRGGRTSEDDIVPNGMGDFMIVQDTEDKFKYYLLLHLLSNSYKSFDIKPGDIIYPEKPVAKVGHSDYDHSQKRANYHLHVSVLRSIEYQKAGRTYVPDDFLNGDGRILNSEYRFPVWERKNEFINPFQQTETWRGRREKQ